jgi:hypothetical protein
MGRAEEEEEEESPLPDEPDSADAPAVANPRRPRSLRMAAADGADDGDDDDDDVSTIDDDGTRRPCKEWKGADAHCTGRARRNSQTRNREGGAWGEGGAARKHP